MRDWEDQHLGDAHAAFDGERVVAEIDQGDVNFAAVVAVDGSRGVDHGDAVFGGQAAARADLGFVALGDRHGEAAGDQLNVAGFEFDVGLYGGGDVKSGRMFGHALGKR